MKPNVEELKAEYGALIDKVLAHRFDFQPPKQRLLQYSGQKGPFWAVLEVWASAGNSGLSPFALAGISGISPRRVLARVRRNPKCSITLVLPMDQAYYISRMQPALSAVSPADSRVRAVVAYGVPMGAIAFRDVVNTWIDVTDAAGLFSDAYDYWVRGKAQTAREPRWSIGSSVLGLW